MSNLLYFASILLTCALCGFLAFYAWRHRGTPGARAYAGLAAGECLLALAEILSVLSPTPELASFWFRARYLAMAVIPIFWLVFALEYSGHKAWLSKRLVAGLFVIPIITQALLWTNDLHGLWVTQEATLHRSGAFWLADIHARLPGLGFLVHSFYSLILLAAGILLLLGAAWRMRRRDRGQALLLAGAGLVAFVMALSNVFNLMPRTEFNLFTPGIGLSVVLIALAAFRFQFLKHAPLAENPSEPPTLAAQTQRSLAMFLLIFTVMATGIAAAGYLSYRDYESQFRAQVDSQLESIARLKVDGIEAWRTERMGDAQLIRQNPAFAALTDRYLGNPADTQAQAQIQAWLDSLYTTYNYDRVSLLDSQGVERLSAPAAAEPAEAHLSGEAAAALNAGQVAFLDFHRDTDGGPIHLALLAPIFAPQDHRPLGVVVLRIDPSTYLYPLIRQWPIPSASAETLLVRRDGTNALYLNELRFRPDAALNLRLPLTNTQVLAVKAVLGQEGIAQGVDYRGVPALGAVRAVPDSPWFLVAREESAEVYAPLRARGWQTAAFLAALLAVAGAGLGLVWRQQRLHYYQGQVAVAEALRASEERYKLANQATFNVIWDWNLLSNALWWNDKFQTVFGYRPEEIAAGIEAWTGPIHPDDRVRVEMGIVAAIDSGQASWSDSYRFRRKDGQYADVEDRGYISRDANGKPLRMIGAMQDVTERKRAEDALRETRDYLDSLIGYANAPIITWDTAVAITRFNRAFERLTGYTVAEVIGQELRILFPEASRDESLTKIARTAGGEFWESVEIPIRRKDGETRIVLWNSANVYAQDGTTLAETIAQGQDITERKRAEDALRASEVRYRRLFEAAMDGILILDAETGMVLDVNPFLTEMFGFSDAEFLGKRIWELGFARSIVADQDHFAELGLKEYTHYEDLQLQTAAGRPIEVEFVSNVYPVNDRKVIQCNIRDVTERKRAETQIRAAQAELQRLLDEADQSRRTLLSVVEDQKTAEEEIRVLNAGLELRVIERTAQLESANKELEAFAYSVSHDLRAPLRGIDGWSLVLLEDYGDHLDAQARQYLDRVRTEAQRMGQLIDAMLQLSRVTRAEMQRGPVDLSVLAQTVVTRLREAQPDRPVEVVIPPNLTAQGDARLIEIVLTNLLGNAWKFTDGRPLARIEIGAIEDVRLPAPVSKAEQRGISDLSEPVKSEMAGTADHAVANRKSQIFFVRDNGAGFDMTYAQNLFGAFQRLHKVSEFPGTGIGLATVQRIIFRHGGQAWAEAAVDQGATFYFTLPAQA